jgi:hypothetical protein
MRIYSFRGKYYVRVQNLGYCSFSKSWKSKTFKTALHALDFGANYMGDGFVHDISPEIYNYALKINHPILIEKDFRFA